jgi:hypothetical protein
MTLVEDNDHLRKLLRQWNEAFGAECYNDALVALSDETEKATETAPAPAPRRPVTDLLVCRSYAELEEEICIRLNRYPTAEYSNASRMLTFDNGNRLHCTVIADRPSVDLDYLRGRLYRCVIGSVLNRYQELVMSCVRQAEFTEPALPHTATATDVNLNDTGESTSL